MQKYATPNVNDIYLLEAAIRRDIEQRYLNKCNNMMFIVDYEYNHDPQKAVITNRMWNAICYFETYYTFTAIGIIIPKNMIIMGAKIISIMETSRLYKFVYHGRLGKYNYRIIGISYYDDEVQKVDSMINGMVENVTYNALNDSISLTMSKINKIKPVVYSFDPAQVTAETKALFRDAIQSVSQSNMRSIQSAANSFYEPLDPSITKLTSSTYTDLDKIKPGQYMVDFHVINSLCLYEVKSTANLPQKINDRIELSSEALILMFITIYQ